MDVTSPNATGPANAASLPQRLLVLLAAAFAALALASACGQNTPRSAGAPRPAASATATKAGPVITSVRRFSAFRADGRPAVRIARSATGSCFAASAAAPTARAYRCFAGNSILDPCFAPAGASVRRLLCLSAPWSAAVRLGVRTLPATTPPIGRRAWAFQTVGGLRCVAATGTVPTVAGVDLPYRCTGARIRISAPVSADLLRAAASAPRTVIAVYAHTGAAAVSRTTVRTVWRG